MSTTDRNRQVDLSADYGQLTFHTEASPDRVRNRTVRCVLLVALALVLAGIVVLYTFRFSEPDSGPPPWWIYALLYPAMALLAWGFLEFLGLISAWRHAGWSIDVYEHGVVESRFGTVQQAMPFSGGVLDLHRVIFTSPYPQIGRGRLDAPWRGELAQADSKIRAAARPVLVRETLAQLKRGNEVSFPGRRNGQPGITLTTHALKLPDNRTYDYSSMRMQYSTSDGTGGYAVTKDPARADGFHFLAEDERGSRAHGGNGVPGLDRTSPNLAVVRETLHILIDPDGHTTYYEQFSHQQQEDS